MKNRTTSKPPKNAERPPRHIETHRLRWSGIDIEVTWEPNWLNLARDDDRDVAHLEIRSIHPLDAPLPVTGTGYRSHFTSVQTVLSLGGPAAFVEAWLEAESQLPDWRREEQERRQLALF